MLTKNRQSDSTINEMIRKAFPKKTVADIKELTEGMCNVTYNIAFSDGEECILKIAAKDTTVGKDLNQIKNTYSILGLFNTDPKEFLDRVNAKKTEDIPEEVIRLAEKRAAARKDKDFKTSDLLRDKIANLGYEIKDSKDGYTIIKK